MIGENAVPRRKDIPIPVLAVYSERFTDSGILIGLTLGAYEISMALMQIPSGRLSDKTCKIFAISLNVCLIHNPVLIDGQTA